MSDQPAALSKDSGAPTAGVPADPRWRLINRVMRLHNHRPHALIETLHAVQEAFGFLDKENLRIVAEALSNVAQHAEASQAWVSAVQQAGGVEIVVRDDGAGFAMDAAAPGAGHYGLVGMRERARLAGGELEVASTPGQGTVVRLFLTTHEG